MAKKPSLTDALNTAGKTTQQETLPEKSPEPIVTKGSGSRAGKRLIAGHFDPAVHRQLKQLSVNENMSIQDLLAEALDDLFQKHGV